MFRKALILLLLLIAVNLPASVHAEPFTIAVPDGPVSLPLLVAIKKRFLEAEGLEVVVRLPCASGKACLDHLRSGAADVAASAEFAVAAAASAESGLAILAVMSESSAQIKLIANRRAGVQSGKDLLGKSVGTIAGTSAQYFLEQWLVYQGLNPGLVKMSFDRPDALGRELQHGKFAAVAIWEPEAMRIKDELGEDAVQLPTAHVYKQHFCVVARGQSVERNKRRFEGFLRAMLKAERHIAAQPVDARDILAASSKVSSNVAERLMAEQDYRLTLKPSLATTMLSQLRWLASRDEKAIAERGRPSSIRHLIDPTLLQALAPNAVSLVR